MREMEEEDEQCFCFLPAARHEATGKGCGEGVRGRGAGAAGRALPGAPAPGEPRPSEGLRACCSLRSAACLPI